METCLLLLLSLGAVFVEQLEELGSSVLVKSMRELGDCRGNLQALVEDDLLALQTDVFGPFDKSGKIRLRSDVLTWDT